MANVSYYVTGNTAKGLVSFLDTNLKGIKKIIALEHPSALLKSNLLRTISSEHQNAELLLSPLGHKYLDGVIFREKSLAILDATIVNNADVTKTIDLNESAPVDEKDSSDVNKLTQLAYDSFATGLKVHDELEEIYIKQMNFKQANQFTTEFIKNLLSNTVKKSANGHMYHRLFGTNTAEGVVNAVPQLTENIGNVDYIKGRAGTGKSTFMKKIAKACTEQGFDVEVYHCSFDPNSLDMVLVRELDFCIFDSTDPHEFFPKRKGERIVDLYEELVTPGTDEKFAAEIERLNNRYKSYMKKGVEFLKQAGELRINLEHSQMRQVNNKQINAAIEELKKYI